MSTQIKKTRIYSAQDLRPGDVIFLCEIGQRKRRPTWPLCNYRRLCVVTQTEKLSDGRWVFHHKEHFKLSGPGSDRLQAALNKNVILTNGSFGANHEVWSSEVVFRLDEIRNTGIPGFQGVSLVGNPAYDLMHDPHPLWNK